MSSKNETRRAWSALLLGIGNEWASDDGVGPEVVRRVKVWWEGLERNATGEVGFVIMAQPDLALLDLLADCDRVIIVDAVRSGARPGTLHRQAWEAGMLGDRGVERASSHGFGVRELLDMARALGKLPPRVELWGVEAASTAPGRGLTPRVDEAVESTAQALAEYLANLSP